MTRATRVVLSCPSDLSDWGREEVEGSPFRAYLRKAHDTASEGDVWEEFVSVGCCGDTLDVDLRVENVEGGDAVDEETTFAFTERDGGEVRGGWRVQSAGGPTQ
ncbi:hypothetical protein SAMN05216559_1018 [Halomicrobium zhouii]|uniref:DUF7968 domain-containing protein n=1 Tax=Halomicrobium zhouii TaxID=767519 RepID=A0A1I6KLQ6_9EURY|nr:hypothetical protein [Halomicrobium zhouii]SFR92147.1 hypothetical protein SAMN05216559_1018 [Halomicrobium zhouii]